MADAGFAPSPTKGTTVLADTIVGIDKGAAIDPVETLFESFQLRAEENATRIVQLCGNMLPANLRQNIIAEEINKLITEKYGANSTKLLADNKHFYDQLHETYHRQIDKVLSERLLAEVDSMFIAICNRAVKRCNRTDIESMYATPELFMTLIDALVREMIAHINTTWAAPSSILFETPRGVDEMVSTGIKVQVIWSSEGRQQPCRGSYKVYTYFPWPGRKNLMMPDHVDETNGIKDLILGRRLLYMKAMFVSLDKQRV